MDLEVLPTLFVHLEETAVVLSPANKIHASVLVAHACVASCKSKFAVQEVMDCVANLQFHLRD